MPSERDREEERAGEHKSACVPRAHLARMKYRRPRERKREARRGAAGPRLPEYLLYPGSRARARGGKTRLKTIPESTLFLFFPRVTPFVRSACAPVTAKRSPRGLFFSSPTRKIASCYDAPLKRFIRRGIGKIAVFRAIGSRRCWGGEGGKWQRDGRTSAIKRDSPRKCSGKQPENY